MELQKLRFYSTVRTCRSFERERAHLKYHNHPGFDCTMPGFFSNSLSINGSEIDNFLARTETVERLSSSATFESGNLKKRRFDSFFIETK
ncbi:unnamed protein product, partial [Eruca vesicaria subsp. sativa]|nr:unnamed protein product [Eruca vesicaria subsp. sativa]